MKPKKVEQPHPPLSYITAHDAMKIKLEILQLLHAPDELIKDYCPVLPENDLSERVPVFSLYFLFDEIEDYVRNATLALINNDRLPDNGNLVERLCCTLERRASTPVCLRQLPKMREMRVRKNVR